MVLKSLITRCFGNFSENIKFKKEFNRLWLKKIKSKREELFTADDLYGIVSELRFIFFNKD